MQNRLQLDFQLQTADERAAFVNKYLEKPQFQKCPPTEQELETIANYMLWGKDSDGLNCTQRKEIQIETKNKTWNRQDTESLDALMESPTFNEASFRRPTEARTKIQREVFDRQKTLAQCPAHLRPTFEELFHRIDTLELGINFYELDHEKRTKQPREALLKEFSESEIESIHAMAATWKQYTYLKQRHLIVELRREQFTLRDSFVETHLPKGMPEPEIEPTTLDFDAEIPVYPMGLTGSVIGDIVFKEAENLHPEAYTDEEIEKVVNYYWQKKEENRPQLFFDFCELEHVYELFQQLEELEDSIDTLPIESNLARLLDTLKYYIRLTDLNEVQKEILDLKISKTKNQDIADIINKKYNKSYTANYISTIFRQKIIPKINESAAFHAKIMENLTFPENFKKCTSCGRILLIHKILCANPVLKMALLLNVKYATAQSGRRKRRNKHEFV